MAISATTPVCSPIFRGRRAPDLGIPQKPANEDFPLFSEFICRRCGAVRDIGAAFDTTGELRYSGAGGQNVADVKKGIFVELLDGTFNLMSRTWMTSLILGGVLFIPSAFLFGWAYGAFFDAFKSIGKVSENPTGFLMALGLAYLWIFLAALAQGLFMLFVRACVTEHSARVVRGEPADTFSIARHVITTRYLPLLGQRVIQSIILAITFSAAILITSVVVAVMIALKLEVLGILLGVILGLGGICLVVWLAVRYMVTLESMVVDGSGIDQAFDQSMSLVKHRWWRVFGYTLLFGLMVSFAASLVGTPIVFFSTIRSFMKVLEEMVKEPSGSQAFNQVFLQIFAGLGRRLGILQYIEGLMAAFVVPVFMTLLFFQLKKPPEPVTQPDVPGTGA